MSCPLLGGDLARSYPLADNNGGGGSSFLGVVVGALLVVVLGVGAFMVLGHQQPSGPSLHVTAPVSPGK